MAMLTDPLWDAPSPNAPELAVRAYRLMMRTLTRIRAQVPGVFDSPQSVSGERVMLEAIAALANPKVDADMRLAALGELQRRMRSVDPTTPQRLFLTQASQRSTVSRSLGDNLAGLAQFDQTLERFTVAQRPGVGLHDATAGLSAEMRAGLLLALCVTRLGQGSTLVLGRVLEALAIGMQPTVAGQWAWLDIELRATGLPELRRIFLDPTTLTAWQLAAGAAASLERPPHNYKAGRQRRSWRQYADRCFGALCRQMVASGCGSSITRLKHLCDCEIQRLRMVTMPVIATYAEAELSSSSLEPGTWCRLIGFNAASTPDRDALFGATPEEAASPNDSSLPLSGIDPGAEADVREQMATGDLEATGVITELRALLNTPRQQWKLGFTKLTDQLRALGPGHQTETLVVCWLNYLASGRRSKGKRLSDGSIRHYRGLLANRLLQVLPDRLSGLTADELESAYTEVIMSRRSTAQTGRIQAALASFDRYVRDQHLPDLPAVSLAGFGGGAYAISSRILVESEYEAGFHALNEGALVLPDQASANELLAFWILAYRFGLRRTEILGLQRRDFDNWVLHVRVNAARHLKTRNARRLLPLAAIPASELRAVHALARGKPDAGYLFFDHIPSAQELDLHPVIARAKRLLQHVTGDPHFHAHNLRHSTATLYLLGALGADLRVAVHPYAQAEPWIGAALTQAERVDREISGALHRKSGRGNALAMLMGHGSERTTYEHYTHCFDLLLFFACWRGHFRPTRQHPWRRLYPPRHEAEQLRALLGLSRGTNVETTDITGLLQRIAALRPNSVTTPAVRNAPGTSSGRRDPETDNDSLPRLTLADLLTLPDAIDGAGYLAKQADRDTVAGLLDQVNQVPTAQRNRFAELLAQWISARRASGDWAAMTAAEARAWAKAMREVLPNITLEMYHEFRGKDGRTKKSTAGVLVRPDAMKDTRGRYCIRVADARRKVSHRKSRSGRTRSRSQRSVTWFVIVFGAYLKQHREEPPAYC